jgi:hypothetical protein
MTDQHPRVASGKQRQAVHLFWVAVDDEPGDAGSEVFVDGWVVDPGGVQRRGVAEQLGDSDAIGPEADEVWRTRAWHVDPCSGTPS